MNLQQTIADLEKKAAEYTEAANALRALLNGRPAPDGATERPAPPNQSGTRARGGRGTKAGKKANKRVVSAETRAKMAAAAKARYQKK